MAAYALVRGRFHGRAAVTSLILAPMVVPIIVVGVAMLGVFLSWKLADNFWGFLIAHTVLAVPFVVITVGTSLGGVDPAIERAAVSLGAPPIVGWRRVTLPLILPGVLAGALFAFVTSFDEVVIALYLKGPNFSTLPVKMYTSVTSEVDPTIAAASTLILLFTTTLILLPLFIRRRHHAE
jgi:putative spermidine/putrescine transport system permease protein